MDELLRTYQSYILAALLAGVFAAAFIITGRMQKRSRSRFSEQDVSLLREKITGLYRQLLINRFVVFAGGNKDALRNSSAGRASQKAGIISLCAAALVSGFLAAVFARTGFYVVAIVIVAVSVIFILFVRHEMSRPLPAIDRIETTRDRMEITLLDHRRQTAPDPVSVSHVVSGLRVQYQIAFTKRGSTNIAMRFHYIYINNIKYRVLISNLQEHDLIAFVTFAHCLSQNVDFRLLGDSAVEDALRFCRKP